MFTKKIKNKKINDRLVVVSSGLFTFLFIEVGFMFYAQTHAVGHTLAHELWMFKNWRVNEIGYRDTLPSQKNKYAKKVFFIGDSFTEGAGLKMGERYTDQLQNILDGNQYAVYNIAKCGADTRMEFSNLSKFPEKPDLLFLQYYQNDIEGVGSEHLKVKINSFKPFKGIFLPLRLLIKNSYFINYIYFKIPKKNYSNYRILINSAFNNEKVIEGHYSDLKKFVEYASAENAKFSIIYFPTLYESLDKSKNILSILKKFSLKNNVDLIDTSICTHKFSKEDRVVNKSDPHPSAEVSLCVAKMLDDYIKKM